MIRPAYPSSSRRLRLERLENRSLLAGGLLAVGLAEFTAAVDASQPQNLTGANVTTDVDTNGNADVHVNANANSNVNNQVSLSTDRAQPAANPLPNNGRTQTDDTFSQGRQTLPVVPVVSSDDTNTTTDSVSATDRVDSDSLDTSKPTTVDSADFVSATDATFASFAEPADVDSDVATLPDHEDTLDLTPLLRSSAMLHADSASEDTWQLDGESLHRLRQTLDLTNDQLAEYADAVVNEWYGSDGGMVDLDYVQLPVGMITLDTVPVDIQLESTLLLYRSLELFSSTASPHIALPAAAPISEPVLDAIMATLGELAELKTQPVDSPATTRMPTLAYPVAAIAATGAAITARLKAKSKERLHPPKQSLRGFSPSPTNA